MNTSDEDYGSLHDELLRAIGTEPVMQSLPHDDLLRGRRLLRRRRLATVTVAAVTVPALVLGGWAVSGALGGGWRSGAGTSELQPAAASDKVSTSPPLLACVPASVLRGHPHRDGSRAQVTQGKADGVRRAAHRSLRLAAACDMAGEGATITSECVSSSGGGTPACDAVPGDGTDLPGVDRLMSVLQTVDPGTTHTGGTLSTGGSVGADNQPSGLYVSTGWVDGDLEGAVALSVEDAATAGPTTDCQDHSIADGPQVTCVEQTLADGTTVMVGHGQLDGAERVTVRYDRPDGTAVIATSDEATDQWWVDGSGAAPLTAQSVSVDQLVALVQNDGNHL